MTIPLGSGRGHRVPRRKEVMKIRRGFRHAGPRARSGPPTPGGRVMKARRGIGTIVSGVAADEQALVDLVSVDGRLGNS